MSYCEPSRVALRGCPKNGHGEDAEKVSNMKPGLYRTEYDNICIVRSPKAKRAWDMDQAEWIPIELVDPNSYIRPIEPGDLDRRMDE